VETRITGVDLIAEVVSREGLCGKEFTSVASLSGVLFDCAGTCEGSSALTRTGPSDGRRPDK
jgi:hypothetical protein